MAMRNFVPEAPDQLWVADITYARSWEGWLYLAFVLDACSRKVVGWSMANHLRTEPVLDALNMAIHNRRPAAGLVHHSDRGSQYNSVEFAGRLREAGLDPSMGSVADSYDNTLAESFISTLKRELLHRHSWPSRESVQAAIFAAILVTGPARVSASVSPIPTTCLRLACAISTCCLLHVHCIEH